MNLKTLMTILACAVTTSVNAQAEKNSIKQPKKDTVRYLNDDERLLHTDWPNLTRYKKQDKQLEDSVNSGERVVFMGNSITEHWLSVEPDYFKTHNNYINRGISGQTTPQMLLRFRQDVIDLKPKVVVILGGTNDIAANTGPASIDEIFGNLKSMYELAKFNHIKIIVVSVLPAYDYYLRPGLHPADTIIALNKKLKAYAASNHIPYVNLHIILSDERKGLPLKFSEDGVHPNRSGYLIMENKLQPVVNRALTRQY